METVIKLELLEMGPHASDELNGALFQGAFAPPTSIAGHEVLFLLR